MQPITKKNIAIAIALLFHVCGFVGIVFTPYKQWFINNTPINLLVSFALLLFTQTNITRQLVLFIAICLVVGFLVEVVGVNTHVLFGDYTYGNVLGYKLFNVPVIIGVQWFVVMYMCGSIMHHVGNWAEKKLIEQGERMELSISAKAQLITSLIDTALLAVFFDYVLEPAAQKLGYWQWQNNTIPFFNYTCWFFISALLQLFFNALKFEKINKFAIHLFIIQILFFIGIRIHLK